MSHGSFSFNEIPAARGHSQARQALWSLDPDTDRERWVQVAMAAKAAGLPFEEFNRWSAGGRTYVARDAAAVWRSIQPEGGIGAGTLYFLARRAGWTGGQSRSVLMNACKTPSTDAYAKRLWLAADRRDAVVAEHPYAQAKDICWAAGAGRGLASGAVIGKRADCLVVPIRENAVGKVQGVQVIDALGQKQTFGAIRGGCLVLGNTTSASVPWYVCEGWASAVSTVFHHFGGNAVCGIAFGKSNLRQTAELLSAAFDPREVIILEEQS